MTVSSYVVRVRGAIPVDIGHKIAVAHAEALKGKEPTTKR